MGLVTLLLIIWEKKKKLKIVGNGFGIIYVFGRNKMSHLKRFEKPFGPQGGISRLGLGALALGTRFFCFSSLRCLVLVILEF